LIEWKEALRQGKVMGKKYSIHHHLKTCTFIEIDALWITINKDYCSKGWISVRIAVCFVSGRTQQRIRSLILHNRSTGGITDYTLCSYGLVNVIDYRLGSQSKMGGENL
jgi:hypothetical protein